MKLIYLSRRSKERVKMNVKTTELVELSSQVGLHYIKPTEIGTLSILPKVLASPWTNITAGERNRVLVSALC